MLLTIGTSILYWYSIFCRELYLAFVAFDASSWVQTAKSYSQGRKGDASSGQCFLQLAVNQDGYPEERSTFHFTKQNNIVRETCGSSLPNDFAAKFPVLQSARL
jgi:hypothetical protein